MQIFPPAKPRILGLDIVRAAAILLVLVAHFLNIWHLGVIGVEMFFVLSGFLIGRILCKDIERTDFTRLEIVQFWRRRWYRTLPNYLVCFFALILAWRAMHLPLGVPLWQYPIFVQNLATTGEMAFFPTSWSLAVEEWAYLILPITICAAMMLKSNRNRRGVLIGAIIVVATPTLLRIGLASGANWDGAIRKVVMFRLDAIGYGVLLAYASMYRSDIMDRLTSPVVATCGALGVLVLYINLGHQAQGPHGPAIWRNALWLSAVSICLIPVIAYARTVATSRSAGIRKIAPIISTYSYSMYLWHLPVLVAVSKYWYLYHGPMRRLVELIVMAVATGLVSWIAYHVVEKPFMDMRDRVGTNVGGTSENSKSSGLLAPRFGA